MLREPLTTAQATVPTEHVNGLEDAKTSKRDNAGLEITYAAARLLRLGLITNTASKLDPPKFRLTPHGLQYMADFEIMRRDVERLNLVLSQRMRRDYIILSLFDKPAGLSELPNLGSVSVLVPASNEARNIAVLLNELARKLPDIREVVVVDGSKDDTPEVARRFGARVIIQRGKGKGDALRQAFEADYGGDIIVTIDADGSNRTEEIPKLVKEIVQGADVAKGSRFLKGGGSTDLTLVRRIGNRLFVSIVNLIWGMDCTDLCYGFVAYRKEALNRLAPTLEANGFEIETEIFIKAQKLGLKVVEVPSVELRRRYGESKLRGVHDSLRIFKTILHELNPNGVKQPPKIETIPAAPSQSP